MARGHFITPVPVVIPRGLPVGCDDYLLAAWIDISDEDLDRAIIRALEKNHKDDPIVIRRQAVKRLRAARRGTFQ